MGYIVWYTNHRMAQTKRLLYLSETSLRSRRLLLHYVMNDPALSSLLTNFLICPPGTRLPTPDSRGCGVFAIFFPNRCWGTIYRIIFRPQWKTNDLALGLYCALNWEFVNNRAFRMQTAAGSHEFKSNSIIS